MRDEGATEPAGTGHERPLVVGTLARLDQIQGLDLLVSAVARLDGVRLLVVGDETGYLVAPDDVGALTVALELLVADAALRERLGAAGRARALERFTAQAMVDAYVRLYREVVAG